ncbi:MAG: methionine--tRNA ligase [Alphaproteobacteria bacterium]
MASNQYYVTTPIYYVNDVPHLGHAYTSIAADVLVRFYRMMGYDAMFLTGVDEHGQKVEKAAGKAGKSPQEFVDEVASSFEKLCGALNLSNDQFIRTTEDRHKKAAQAMWNRLVERGQIYKSSYKGWYSVRDETYFAESELVDGKAPTGADVEWVEEPSYFFKLSEWQEPLLKFYEENPDFIGPKSRRNEVISFVKNGLMDLSISRSTFSWGVPVPDDPDHVMYVWIEALTNYLTALGFPDDSEGDVAAKWPVALHLIGKDILRHHAVYWPAILLAAGLDVPKRIYAHGWWTREGQKMSKSLGNVIDPFALVESHGLDQTRYFVMRQVTFGSDGDFSELAFISRVNSDLANDLGNLIQRVLSFIQKNAGAEVPTAAAYTDADNAMLKQSRDLPEILHGHMDGQQIHKYCEVVWQVIGEANRYIDVQEPWALRKTDTERMNTVLNVLVNVIRDVCVYAWPIMPDSMEKALSYLGVSGPVTLDLVKDPLKPGVSLPKPEGLFPRITETE